MVRGADGDPEEVVGAGVRPAPEYALSTIPAGRRRWGQRLPAGSEGSTSLPGAPDEPILLIRGSMRGNGLPMAEHHPEVSNELAEGRLRAFFPKFGSTLGSVISDSARKEAP